MNDAPLPEPLEQFLQAPPSLPAESAFQHAVLQQTLSSLPVRRTGNRWGLIGAFAASVALAFGAGWYASRLWSEAPPRTEIVERKPPEPRKEAPIDPPIVPTSTNPQALEWAAFDAMEDRARARLYFRAGDMYFEKHDDLPSALRCYQQAIASCSADQLAFDPNDNWFLLTLKVDHLKER